MYLSSKSTQFPTLYTALERRTTFLKYIPVICYIQKLSYVLDYLLIEASGMEQVVLDKRRCMYYLLILYVLDSCAKV